MRLRATRLSLESWPRRLGLPLDFLPFAAAAYGSRLLRTAYTGSAIRVRRSSDNVESDIGFDANGDLNLDALTLFCGAPRRPLLAVAGAAAAYSLRRLGAYSGPAIRVRRSSDNSEQDIGFTAAGDLDTNALLAFVGSGSGFVATWYDQSGNGRDVTQATAGSQPRIVDAGVLETLSGKPTIFFDGANHILFRNEVFLYAAGASTTCAVLSGAAQADKRIVAEGSSTNSLPSYSAIQTNVTTTSASAAFIRNTANTLVLTANTVLSSNVFNSLPNVLVHTDTGSSITGFLNGTAGTPAAYTRSGSLPMDRFAIGGLQRATSAAFFAGRVSEVIAYTSALSTGSRQLIESSQSVFYGITYANTIPSGFVTTWYDQSGNARNATQGTAANQPRIVNAGAIETSGSGGRPTVVFSGSQWLQAGSVTLTQASANVVAALTGTLGVQHIIRQNATSGPEWSLRSESTQWQWYSLPTSVKGGTVTAGALTVVTGLASNGANSQVLVNGTSVATAGIVTPSPTIGPLALGAGPGGLSPISGALSETFVFSTSLSTPDRQALDRNQGTYYGIAVA